MQDKIGDIALIIEDEPLILDFVAEIAEMVGRKPLTAKSGYGAVAQFVTACYGIEATAQRDGVHVNGVTFDQNKMGGLAEYLKQYKDQYEPAVAVLLTDNDFPEMGGLRTTEVLCSIANHDFRKAMMSGRMNEPGLDLPVQAAGVGITCCYAKPLNVADIMHALQ